MSEKLDSNTTDTKDEKDKAGKGQQALVDYLQSPRKKRKNFVVIATGPSVDNETVQAMVRFVKTAYPKCSIATPQSPDEFVRQFTRNIVLAIIDDNFVGLENTLELVKAMKKKKSDAPVPVLFMTREPDKLISGYRDKLALWQEVDEYVVPAAVSRAYLFAKIKSGIDDRYRRKSRRYKVQFPVMYTILDSGDKKFRGTIVDMSVHGALLKTEDEHTFTVRDQLTVHMPYGMFVPETESDIMRISAKVRRIFIAGDRAGVSWEHMSDIKVEQLSRMLTSIVNVHLHRTASAARGRIAKAEADAASSHQNPLKD